MFYALYFFYHQVDFLNSGDISVLKEMPCFIGTALAEGRKLARTTTLALVDRGDFSLLTSLPQSELIVVSTFRLTCSSHRRRQRK